MLIKITENEFKEYKKAKKRASHTGRPIPGDCHLSYIHGRLPSSTLQIPATKHFHQPIILKVIVSCSSVKGFSNIALSSLIYVKFSAHFIQINTCQRAMTGIGDYTFTTFDYVMY